MVLSKHSPFLRGGIAPVVAVFDEILLWQKKHISRFAQEMSYLLGDSHDQHMAPGLARGRAVYSP